MAGLLAVFTPHTGHRCQPDEGRVDLPHAQKWR